MADDVRVNGNQHSFSSIILKIDDEKYYGFKSISYSDSRERTKTWGAGRHGAPRGRSAGKYDVENITVTMYKGSAQILRLALANAGNGTSYGDTEVTIIVQFIEADDTEITDELERCVYVKSTSSSEEGPDSLTEDIEFSCMLIRRNGLTLFDNTLPQI